MELEGLLIAALQSSFLLGLLHGVNPCGHSWLVLAPFVAGERQGRRVTLLTSAFLLGTALACVVLGASLGAISQVMPTSLGVWVEGGTSVVLMIIGLLLLYNPHILHHHNHDHDHDHAHHHNSSDHSHHHDHHHNDSAHNHHEKRSWISSKFKELTKSRKMLPLALFGIGFVNMIIPCPTAAVMYGYALNSGHILTATLVFTVYAVSTAIAVGGVIYLMFKATSMASSLQKEWVEPLIMRTAGLVIVVFSGYGVYAAVAAS